MTSSKTLTDLNKSAANCEVFTEILALKNNSSSKLNSDISKNVSKSSDSSTLADTLESHKSIHEAPPVKDQTSALRFNDYVRN